MLKTLTARLQQGQQTVPFGRKVAADLLPVLPSRFRGRPVVDQSKCESGCRECIDACPTEAISKFEKLRIDLGRCLFCTACIDSCPSGLIKYTNEYRMASRERDALIVDGDEYRLARALDARMKRIFGRSLKLRQISAGGCNGCEVEVNATSNIVFDIARFGIQFVASPRHADGILVTGPIPENMHLAVKKTYDAIPHPKFVIATGACAISGGPYRDHPEVHNGIGSVIPVDLHIPGCPPHPLTILDGLLRFLGRIER